MNEGGLFDFIDDPEDAKRKSQFRGELERIQEKYIDWFITRPPVFEHQEHDELSNHVASYGERFSIKIGFHQESNLPEYIRKEIMDAADRCFL